MILRGGGDAFDRFFLAMTHWHLDQREEARTWYDKAVQWMDTNQPEDDELRYFRVGATLLIGVSGAAPPTDKVKQPQLHMQTAVLRDESLEPYSTSSE